MNHPSPAVRTSTYDHGGYPPRKDYVYANLLTYTYGGTTWGPDDTSKSIRYGSEIMAQARLLDGASIQYGQSWHTIVRNGVVTSNEIPYVLPEEV